MSTESQIHANRINAQSSTGPRTPEGKAASSANSTKHGLSGAFRVLDNENQDEFNDLIAEYHRHFKPTNTHEQFLIEEMVQARWRLARARRLETELIENMVAQRHSADADAMMCGALRNDTASAFTSLQRYANSLERAAFRALDQLMAMRKQEAKLEAKLEAKQEARTARAAAPQNEPNFTPTNTNNGTKADPPVPTDTSPHPCSSVSIGG